MYESIRECMGFYVLGSTGKLADFVADYEMVVAIGNAQIRQRIMNQVDAVNGKIATVDHECRISDYVHVLVGIGAVVSNNLTVCLRVSNCLVHPYQGRVDSKYSGTTYVICEIFESAGISLALAALSQRQ